MVTTKGQILIIEEPESFTTPESQSHLGAYLLKHSAQFGTWILLSTHSEQLLSRLKPCSIHSVYCLERTIKTKTSNAKTMNHLEKLGLSLQKKGIFFVEDQAAKLFLDRSLATHTTLKRSFYITIYDGEGNIFSAMGALEKAKNTFQFIAVFDGDLRNSCTLEPIVNKFCFLPGDTAPEALLFDHLIEHEPETSSLGIEPSECKELLETAASLDIHDRIYRIAEMTGKTYPEVFNILFDIWSNSDSGRALLDAFLNELTRLTQN